MSSIKHTIVASLTMLMELQRRRWQVYLHKLWLPHKGDRIEVLAAPQDTMGNRGVMQIGEHATISDILPQHSTGGQIFVFAKDDGTEMVWEFFHKEYIRPLSVSSGKRKH